MTRQGPSWGHSGPHSSTRLGIPSTRGHRRSATTPRGPRAAEPVGKQDETVPQADQLFVVGHGREDNGLGEEKKKSDVIGP